MKNSASKWAGLGIGLIALFAGCTSRNTSEAPRAPVTSERPSQQVASQPAPSTPETGGQTRLSTFNRDTALAALRAAWKSDLGLVGTWVWIERDKEPGFLAALRRDGYAVGEWVEEVPEGFPGPYLWAPFTLYHVRLTDSGKKYLREYRENCAWNKYGSNVMEIAEVRIDRVTDVIDVSFGVKAKAVSFEYRLELTPLGRSLMGNGDFVRLEPVLGLSLEGTMLSDVIGKVQSSDAVFVEHDDGWKLAEGDKPMSQDWLYQEGKARTGMGFEFLPGTQEAGAGTESSEAVPGQSTSAPSESGQSGTAPKGTGLPNAGMIDWSQPFPGSETQPVPAASQQGNPVVAAGSPGSQATAGMPPSPSVGSLSQKEAPDQTPSTQAEASLDDGLVAYYQFEGNASDSSGFGNNGTVHNARFTSGRFGQGLEFTGQESSYVEIPHSTSLTPPDGVTIAVWAKVYSNLTWHSCLVYKAGEVPRSPGFRDRVFALWVKSDGGVHFTSTPDGAGSQATCDTSSGSYSHNEFVHFVGVVDSVHQRMSIYVNGRKVSERPYPGSQIRGGEYPMRIGGCFRTLGDQSGLTGILDDVRIYNRALSDSEIALLYNHSPGKEASRQTSSAQIRGGEFKQFEGYALTRYHYSETADLDAAVRAEFGDTTEVADWNEIKAQFSGRAEAFANGIGLTQYDEGVLVYRGRVRYWSGNRHFFLARHDGRLPNTYTFLVHDEMDNHVLDLGSWYGLSMHVIVKLR